MTVTTTGGTVNYIIFHNDNDVDVNITTGATEGSFSVTIDNGISKTFNNVLLIIGGAVFKPISTDWNSITNNGDVSEVGALKIIQPSIQVSGYLNYVIAQATDFQFFFKNSRSPLKNSPTPFNKFVISFWDSAKSTKQYDCVIRISDENSLAMSVGYGSNLYLNVSSSYNLTNSFLNDVWSFKRIAGVMTFLLNDVLKHTFPEDTIGDLIVKVEAIDIDVTDIKYVDFT